MRYGYGVLDQRDLVKQIFEMSQTNTNEQEYKVLVMSGGGLSAIKYMEELTDISNEYGINFTNEFDCFVGTSAGSLVATGLARNLPVEYILDVANTVGREAFSPRAISVDSIRNHGLISKEPLINGIKTCLVNGEKTLKEIYCEHGKDLVIVANQIEEQRVINFSNVSTPYLSAIKAASASCSIPYVYPSEIIDGDEYVDGGYFAQDPVLNAIYFAVVKRRVKLENIKMVNVMCSVGEELNSNDLKLPTEIPKMLAISLNNIATLHMALGQALLGNNFINLITFDDGKESIGKQELIEYLKGE